MARKLPLADDDGNTIPPTENEEVKAIIYLLEWGRKRGFKLGPMIQIGDTTVQVRDMRFSEEGEKLPPEGDIWAEHGHVEEKS